MTQPERAQVVEYAASNPATPLRMLPPPGRLLVPIGEADAAQLKPVGTHVARGERLTGSNAIGGPIAPAGGVIGATKQATLLNGATTAAVELLEVEPASADTVEAGTTTADTPADVAALIDRLRAMAVR